VEFRRIDDGLGIRHQESVQIRSPLVKHGGGEQPFRGRRVPDQAGRNSGVELSLKGFRRSNEAYYGDIN